MGSAAIPQWRCWVSPRGASHYPCGPNSEGHGGGGGGGGGVGKDRRLGLLTSICAHISAAYAELVMLRWGTSATSTEPSLHIPL